MQFDASPAPGLTRRARRASDAVPTAPEASSTAALTRAERRRRGLLDTSSTPAVPAADEVSLVSRRAARLAGIVAAQALAPALSIAPQRLDLPGPEAAGHARSTDIVAASTAVDESAADEVNGDVVELLVVDESSVDESSVDESVVDESVVDDDATASSATERAHASSESDAFVRAAAVFSFTGASAVLAPRTPDRAASAPGAGPDAAPARTQRRRRRVPVKRIAAASFSVGVMGAVGLLALGTAAPAEAIAAALNRDTSMSVRVAEPAPKAVEDEEIQAFVSSSVDTDLNRSENYRTETLEQMAADTGITNYSNFFVNDANAAVQWPFAVGVPITDTWGPRWGSFHHGVDFTPGEGADIQAVADGTVRIATENGGLYGVYVVVDHEIDGHQVSSLYAHMLRGSMKVEPGDTVKVGDILGNTGNTGMSYGAHTHFEITLDGVRVDPLQWLRENAGG